MRTYLPTGKVPSTDRPNHYRWQGWHPDGSRIEPHDFAIARALRGETVVPGLEFQFIHDDGRARWTRVAAAPLRDADGEVTGVFAIAVDTTTSSAPPSARRCCWPNCSTGSATSCPPSMPLPGGRAARGQRGRVRRAAVRAFDVAGAHAEPADPRRQCRGLPARDDRRGSVGADAGTGLCELHGEDVLLPPKAAEVLSLAIHELASNALRYGAAAREAGRIEVSWHLQVQDAEPWLGLHWWRAPCRRGGLGNCHASAAWPGADRAARALRAGWQRRAALWPTGLDAWIRFPLRERDSLLQTDAPDTAPLR